MLMQVWSQHQSTSSLCDCIDLPAEPSLLSGNKAEHWFIGSRQLPFDSFSVHMAFVPAGLSVNTCTGTLETVWMLLITLCPLPWGVSKKSFTEVWSIAIDLYFCAWLFPQSNRNGAGQVRTEQVVVVLYSTIVSGFNIESTRKKMEKRKK